jgi:hypothetical protein
MSQPARRFCLLSVVFHLALAFSLAHEISPLGGSAAAVAQARWGVPNWLWPVLFTLNAFLAVRGYWSGGWLRASFLFGAALMFVWAGVSATLFFSGRATATGAIFLFYIGLLKVLVATYSWSSERIDQKAVDLEEFMAEVEHDRA